MNRGDLQPKANTLQCRDQPKHAVFRRSGLRVRPLLRHAFQPQQQQARSHAARHHAQQQQAAARTQEAGRQQPAQSSQRPENQGQVAGLPSGEPDSDNNLQAQAASIQQGQSEAQEPQAGSSSVGGEEQPNATVVHADQGAGSQAKGGKASSKGQKSKKTKKDYAAWAGATAETRALATSHLEGNPDIAHNSQPMHACAQGMTLLTDSILVLTLQLHHRKQYTALCLQHVLDSA